MIKIVFLFFISCEKSIDSKKEIDVKKYQNESESGEKEIIQENFFEKEKEEELKTDFVKENTVFEKIVYEKPFVEKNFFLQKIPIEKENFKGSLKGKISYFFEKQDPLIEYLKHCFENNLSLDSIEYFLKYYSLGSLDGVFQEILKQDHASIFFNEYQLKKTLKRLHENEVKTLEQLEKTKNFTWKKSFLKKDAIYFISERMTLNPNRSYLYIVDEQGSLYEIDSGKSIKEVLTLIDPVSIYNKEEIVFFQGQESLKESFWVSFHSLETITEKNTIYTIFLNQKKENKEALLEVKTKNITIVDNNEIYDFSHKRALIVVEQLHKKPLFMEEKINLNGYKFSLNIQNKNRYYFGQSVVIPTIVKKMKDYHEMDDIFSLSSSGTILTEGKTSLIYCDQHCSLSFDKKEYGQESIGTIEPRFSLCKNISKISYPQSLYERFSSEGRFLSRVYNFGQNCHLPLGQCEDTNRLDKECALSLLQEYPVKYEENLYYYEQNYQLTIYSLND